MNKLTLYISKTLFLTILLAIVLLVGLEFIFSFVNETRYVGKGDYTLSLALVYVILLLPQQISEMFPMAALVGTLLGLGWLASRSELIVMQAAGLSIADIIKMVLKVAVIWVLFIWVLGEVLAPYFDGIAHDKKTIAMSRGQAIRTNHGVWLRDGQDFIHIEKIDSNRELTGVTRYQFDENLHLMKTTIAQKAIFDEDGWHFYKVDETEFLPQRIVHQWSEQQNWINPIAPEILQVIHVKETDELSLLELWKTMNYRLSNNLDAKAYQLAFWQKLFQPLAILVMMFLAIPFVFGSLRNATMGFRLLIGVLIGFSFYTLNQLFGPLSQVYAIPPVIAAMLPILLFLLVGLFLLKNPTRDLFKKLSV